MPSFRSAFASFPTYKFLNTPVSLYFIHWTHTDWLRCCPMPHITCTSLAQQLPDIAQYRVRTGLKSPLARAKKIREHWKCSEWYKTPTTHVMCYEFKMSHLTTTTTPHRQRCYWSKKRPRKFFGVSSHEKRKQAHQLFESHKGEGQPLKIEAKTTSTGIGGEGWPSTSLGVEVAASMTPGLAMHLGEVESLRTKPPALLHPLSRSTAQPSPLWSGATLKGSETTSGQKLSLSDTSQSLAGEICMPNIERMNVNVWEEGNIHSGDVHGAPALISLSRQYHSIDRSDSCMLNIQ